MHAKIWKCKFRYSGVRKMYEVWGGGGGPYHGGGGWDPGSGLIYIYIFIIQSAIVGGHNPSKQICSSNFVSFPIMFWGEKPTKDN